MSLPTKLAVVLRSDLQPALAINATAVLGLSWGGRLPELLGKNRKDASGAVHVGLNTHPVPILTASPDQIRQLSIQARDAWRRPRCHGTSTITSGMAETTHFLMPRRSGDGRPRHRSRRLSASFPAGIST